MEDFLTHCASFTATNYPLAISIILAGLIGSLTHCSMMCSPLVIAQMFELKAKRQHQGLIAFYHLGRILIYALLGVISFYSARFIFGGEFAGIMHLVLVIAGTVFIVSALFPRKTHHCCDQRIPAFKNWLNRHFNGGFLYFIRGLMMGFMPCGMVLSVLLMTSTMAHPLYAAGLMLLFGLSTVPALQLSALALLRLGRRHPQTGFTLARILMATNGFLLCAVGSGIVYLH